MSKPFGIFSLVTLFIIAFLVTFVFISHDSGRRDVLFSSALIAADSTVALDVSYVGSEKCRICHLEIYKSWATTKHASAASVLTTSERDSSACISCHSTGQTAAGEMLENVGCEGCHGPGSEFRKMRIMKNRELAIQHGLTMRAQAVCVKCHNDMCEHSAYLDVDLIDFDQVHVILSSESKY